MKPLFSYPIRLNLAGRRVLVAGAGSVATRKIERLVETEADVWVVAPEASPKVHELAAAGRLTLRLREAQDDDVLGALLVLCATSRREVNQRLSERARAAGALVSRVDAPEASDFTVPALARGESAEATVSTGGRAPSASRRLARELRAWLSRGPDRFAREMAEARSRLRGHPQAGAVLRELAEGPLFDACVAGDEARIRTLLETARNAPYDADAPQGAPNDLDAREAAR